MKKTWLSKDQRTPDIGDHYMNGSDHTFHSRTFIEYVKNILLTGVISCRTKRAINCFAGIFCLTVFSLVSLHAASQPQQQACMDVDSITHAKLKTLFRYSQLAERPKDRLGESTSCSDVRPLRINPISIPSDLFDDQQGWFGRDQITNKVRGLLETHGMSPDIHISLENINNTIHASCEIDDAFWSVAIRLYEISNNLFLEADVAAKKNSEGMAWIPIQIDGPPPIIRFPGTTIKNPGQWAANFVGEACIFPAATYTVEAICESYRENQLVFADTGETFFATENGATTLVGHSLGGAAVQYISHFVPHGSCGNIDVYAFGSIGLQSLSNEHMLPIGVSLQTYVSQCDWLAQMLFHDSKQAGNITSMESDEHTIDEIQNDICKCINGDEQLNMVNEHHTAFTGPVSNRQLGGLQCAKWR